MAIEFWLKKGDLLPALLVTLTDADGDAFDLSGASKVEFRFTLPDGTSITREATVTDAANGAVSYTWQSGDTAVVGVIEGEFVATIGGKLQTFPSRHYVQIQVAESLA